MSASCTKRTLDARAGRPFLTRRRLTLVGDAQSIVGQSCLAQTIEQVFGIPHVTERREVLCDTLDGVVRLDLQNRGRLLTRACEFAESDIGSGEPLANMSLPRC